MLLIIRVYLYNSYVSCVTTWYPARRLYRGKWCLVVIYKELRKYSANKIRMRGCCVLSTIWEPYNSISVGYTLDNVIYKWLESPVQMNPRCQIAQFSLTDLADNDCSQNYTAGRLVGISIIWMFECLCAFVYALVVSSTWEWPHVVIFICFYFFSITAKPLIYVAPVSAAPTTSPFAT